MAKSIKNIYWVPQPGPQAEACVCPVDEVFFGGTRGGGKTDTALGRQIDGACKYHKYWNGLMIRRKYKDFSEIRRRVDGMIIDGMPAERIGGENQMNYIRFANGATITLAAIARLEIADDFQGQQFTEISFEEAPLIPFIAQLIDRMKGCLRSPYGVPCYMFLTGNPGGPGASAIKVMYIDPVPEGDVNYIERENVDGSKAILTRVFIKSTVYDNKILLENDPGYPQRLLSIADPRLRAAWHDGEWGIPIGQAFNFTEAHIIEPIWPIPEYAPIYMTFDWGYGKPFSLGWWWVDGEDRIYRFGEWYGWDGVTPNIGLRLEDPKIAEGVLERERAMGILGRPIKRLSGPDCFNKKPDYKGGGQGPSTADEFINYAKQPDTIKKYGAQNLELFPGDPSRELKIRQFRNRLALPADPTELPMMVIYNTCRQFIRIIPALCSDELTGEYLEEGQELHPFDEACHVCMAMPMGVPDEWIEKERAKKRKEAERAKLDNPSRSAAEEWDAILEALKEDYEPEEFPAGVFPM